MMGLNFVAVEMNKKKNITLNQPNIITSCLIAVFIFDHRACRSAYSHHHKAI